MCTTIRDITSNCNISAAGPEENLVDCWPLNPFALVVRECGSEQSYLCTAPLQQPYLQFPKFWDTFFTTTTHIHNLFYHFKKKIPYQPKQKLFVQGHAVNSCSRARILSSWIIMLGSSNYLCSQETVFILITGGEIGRRHEKFYRIPMGW